MSEATVSAVSAIPAVPAIAFVGKQNSGKTVLLEKVITALTRRGIRVASIKHHSHAGFEFDVAGKDSWRHRQAGSVQTVIVAPDQIATVRSLAKEPSLSQVIEALLYESALYNEMPQLILVEGYRRGGLPTVELFRAANPNDAERDLGAEGNKIIAVVTDIDRVVAQAKEQGVPAYGLEDIEPLCDFLMNQIP